MTCDELWDAVRAKGFLTEHKLQETISELLEIPLTSLKRIVIDESLSFSLDIEVCKKGVMIPIYHYGTTVVIGTSSPYLALRILKENKVKMEVDFQLLPSSCLLYTSDAADE